MAIFRLSKIADRFTGTAANDVFSGPGGGLDTLRGGGGNDVFTVDAKQVGTIDGGIGTDSVRVQNVTFDPALVFSTMEHLVLTQDRVGATFAQLNAFSSILPTGNTNKLETDIGGAGGIIDFSTRVSAGLLHFSAFATANSSAETITAPDCDSTIFTGRFNDKIVGGSGDDFFEGGNGNDVIYGGLGNDQLDGGAGSNTAAFSTVARAVAVDLAAGTASGQGTDVLNLFQNVVGSRLNDKITGDAQRNVLTGGLGADRLTGGAGADTFVYKAIGESTVAAAGRDLLLDFDGAQGDKINLAGIDANAVAAGNQAFTFLGTKSFTGSAGQLDYAISKGVAYVYGDVNGDKKADFSIAVTNPNLTASNFVL